MGTNARILWRLASRPPGSDGAATALWTAGFAAGRFKTLAAGFLQDAAFALDALPAPLVAFFSLQDARSASKEVFTVSGGCGTAEAFGAFAASLASCDSAAAASGWPALSAGWSAIAKTAGGAEAEDDAALGRKICKPGKVVVSSRLTAPTIMDPKANKSCFVTYFSLSTRPSPRALAAMLCVVRIGQVLPRATKACNFGTTMGPSSGWKALSQRSFGTSFASLGKTSTYTGGSGALSKNFFIVALYCSVIFHRWASISWPSLSNTGKQQSLRRLIWVLQTQFDTVVHQFLKCHHAIILFQTLPKTHGDIFQKGQKILILLSRQLGIHLVAVCHSRFQEVTFVPPQIFIKEWEDLGHLLRCQPNLAEPCLQMQELLLSLLEKARQRFQAGQKFLTSYKLLFKSQCHSLLKLSQNHEKGINIILLQNNYKIIDSTNE